MNGGRIMISHVQKLLKRKCNFQIFHSSQDVLQLRKKLSTTFATKLQQVYSERLEIASDYVYCYITGLLLSSLQTELAKELCEKIEEKCFDFFNKIM